MKICAASDSPETCQRDHHIITDRSQTFIGRADLALANRAEHCKVLSCVPHPTTRIGRYLPHQDLVTTANDVGESVLGTPTHFFKVRLREPQLLVEKSVQNNQGSEHHCTTAAAASAVSYCCCCDVWFHLPCHLFPTAAAAAAARRPQAGSSQHQQTPGCACTLPHGGVAANWPLLPPVRDNRLCLRGTE